MGEQMLDVRHGDQQLSLNLVPQMRLQIGVAALVIALFVGSQWLMLSQVAIAPIWGGVIFLAVVAMLAPLLVWYPKAYWRHAGYRFGGHALHVRSGVWMRSEKRIPIERIQYVDILEGPLDRYFDVKKLSIHTAGTRFARILIPGMEAAAASTLREQLLSSGADDDV